MLTDLKLLALFNIYPKGSWGLDLAVKVRKGSELPKEVVQSEEVQGKRKNLSDLRRKL